jgi:glycosyltransferase involved in cell wall biosynthesis
VIVQLAQSDSNDHVKKLAVITPSKFPGSAGDTANYSEIMNQLITENIRIILICPINPHQELKNSLSTDVSIVRIPYAPPRLTELQGGLRLRHYLRLLCFLFAESFIVFSALRKNKIRYVYMRHGVLTLHIPLILRLLRVKSLADGELFADSSANLKLPSIFLRILGQYERLILKLYTGYRVSTLNQIERLLRVGYPRDRIALIPISINIDRIPAVPLNQIPQHTFGYFGALEPWQGIDILLKAFEVLSQQVPSAKLYIIGQGSMQQDLEMMTRNNGISSKVFFVGGISRETIWSVYFRKFRILVVPRPKLNNSFDSLPSLKIIEALAGGKPVIATDIPAMRDFPEECLLLVPPQDHKCLANAMGGLSSDEAALHRRASSGLDYVKRHNIKQNIHLFLNSLAR